MFNAREITELTRSKGRLAALCAGALMATILAACEPAKDSVVITPPTGEDALVDGAASENAQEAPAVQFTRLDAEQIYDGKQARYPAYRAVCPLEAYSTDESCDLTRPTQVLVFGDGQEVDTLNFLSGGYGDDMSVNFIRFGNFSRCDGSEGGAWQNVSEECGQRYAALQNRDFVQSLDSVVYAFRAPYDANKADAIAVIRQIQALNPAVKLVVMRPFIEINADCSDLANAAGTAAACLTEETVRTMGASRQNKDLQDTVEALANVAVDRIAVACPTGELSSCKATSNDGTLIMYDRANLSYAYSADLGKRYARNNPDLLINARN